MTAALVPFPVPRARRRVRIEVDRHELVGGLMDAQALAEEAIDANGASLEVVLRLPPGPWRDELQRAHIAAHDALKALLKQARLMAGTYDGLPHARERTE